METQALHILLLLLLSCAVLLCCSGIKVQPPSFEGSEGFTLETTALFRQLTEARVHKTAGEVALMKYVNHLGSRAHVAMMQVRGRGVAVWLRQCGTDVAVPSSQCGQVCTCLRM